MLTNKQPYLGDYTGYYVRRNCAAQYRLISSADGDLGCKALFMGLGDRKQTECDDLWRIWFANGNAIKTVQNWLRVAPSTGDVKKDGWAQSASVSAKALLKPLARVAASMWLTKLDYEDEAYCDKSEFQVLFLKAYLSMEDSGEVSSDIANFVWARDGTMYGLSQDEVEKMAAWADLEKSTHWYTGLGWTLFEATHYDAALAYCQKAIDMVCTPNIYSKIFITADRDLILGCKCMGSHRSQSTMFWKSWRICEGLGRDS